jgi:hypothetical protein
MKRQIITLLVVLSALSLVLMAGQNDKGKGECLRDGSCEDCDCPCQIAKEGRNGDENGEGDDQDRIRDPEDPNCEGPCQIAQDDNENGDRLRLRDGSCEDPDCDGPCQIAQDDNENGDRLRLKDGSCEDPDCDGGCQIA